MEAFIFLIIWLAFGFGAALIMSNNGRSGGIGFAVGFFLGPIGLIIALLMGKDEATVEKDRLAGGELRKCPVCAESVRREAIKCRFCQTDLEPLAPIEAHVVDPNRWRFDQLDEDQIARQNEQLGEANRTSLMIFGGLILFLLALLAIAVF